MDRYQQFKEDLIGITRSTAALCDELGSLSGVGEAPTAHWRRTCEEIGRQVSAEILRVAVVGPIKSGKSTFVNALFRGDYLKRGAGVVTSIVTRIRKGERLHATLFFKSWGEINREIESAMVLFPASDWRSGSGPFDLRDARDREDLARALAGLSADRLITRDARNLNSVIIGAYLEGYERVREIVSEEPATLAYDGEAFGKHKAFTGDDTLAVFLRDIELTIDSGGLDETIEIADCQGSDSPNPLHLAMIQEYLRATHLIVYVVSGRTGLRQADIRFLSTIKRMGILDSALFLINVDFGEHDSLDDLMRVAAKTRDDIALLRPEPDVYALSALFNLFKSSEDALPVKDRLRLAQWRGEAAMTAYSDAETIRFETTIHRKLTEERYALLLKNHLERLGLQVAGMAHWARVRKDMFGKDAREVARIVREIGAHHGKIAAVKKTMRSTLSGTVEKLKQELKRDVDRFFDKHDGILGEALRFLRGYHPIYAEWEHHVSSAGFSSALYHVFQEVRRTLDGFMAESVNPEIIRFIREEEDKIRDHFAAVAGSYEAMARDALSEYNRIMADLELPPLGEAASPVPMPEVAAIVRSTGLKVPPAVAAMQYSATIRGEAVMRLGLYRIVRFLRKVFKRPPRGPAGEELLALKDGIMRLKRETEQSISFHFTDYRENIKFQYLLSLADAVSEAFYEALVERFDGHVSDLEGMATLIEEKTADAAETRRMLEGIEAVCRRIAADIERLKAEIASAA